MDEILINFRCDCIVRNQCLGMLLVLFMLLKVTEKVSLDCNTYSPIVYRIHGYRYCLLSWLLFTVYATTITVTILLLLLSLYHPSILSNMDIDCVKWINNNVKRQLTLGLEKLVEETTSVFWMDLRYRLRNRLTVPLQGSGGWLTSHLFIVPQYYCKFIVPQWYCEYCYCYWLPEGRAWFSARHLGRDSGYIGTYLKHG